MARGLLIVGGAILLLQPLFGLLAILAFGFDSPMEATTALALTLAFPIYLIGLKSLRVASWALWLFFLAQWANECVVSHPRSLVNPLDWPHGVTLLAGIVLVQIAYVMLKGSSSGRPVSLPVAFERR